MVELCDLYPTMSTAFGYDYNCDLLEDWGDNLFKREEKLVRKYVSKAAFQARRNPNCVESQTFHQHMITRLKCLSLDRTRMFNKDGGWCVEIFETISVYQRYDTGDAIEKAETRIQSLPDALKKYVDMMKREADREPPSCIIVQRMRERIERLPDETVAMPNFLASLVREHFFLPVAELVIPFLKTVRCRSTLGLSHRPDLYKAAIFRHVTIDGVTANDIHEVGLKEVSRIEDLLQEMPLPEQQTIYCGEEAVQRYASIVRRVEADPILDELFGDMRPVRSCMVKEMRESHQEGGPLAYYSNSTFSVNVKYKHVEYQMEALAFHEAVPGHHTQRMIERQSNVEPGYRVFVHHTAFVEGWAMYTEGLMNTLLPHSKRGILERELFRAVRLVVDTGIHFKGWSYEKALEYVNQHGRVTEDEGVNEVIRYACDPGQALGYHIGRMVFRDIRNRHKDNLVEIHRRILTQGSVPMRVLIRQFLTSDC